MAEAAAPAAIPARDLTIARARTGLQALHDATAGMMAKLDGLANERTELTALGAGLDLIALACPPVAILRDGFEILTGVLLLHQLGIASAARPDQPSMMRAAGPTGMGGH